MRAVSGELDSYWKQLVKRLGWVETVLTNVSKFGCPISFRRQKNYDITDLETRCQSLLCQKELL